jgi:hypothetical protein
MQSQQSRPGSWSVTASSSQPRVSTFVPTHDGGSVDVTDVSSDTGGESHIKEPQLGDQRVVLEQEGQRLSDSSRGTEDGDGPVAGCAAREESGRGWGAESTSEGGTTNHFEECWVRLEVRWWGNRKGMNENLRLGQTAARRRGAVREKRLGAHRQRRIPWGHRTSRATWHPLGRSREMKEGEAQEREADRDR